MAFEVFVLILVRSPICWSFRHSPCRVGLFDSLALFGTTLGSSADSFVASSAIYGLYVRSTAYPVSDSPSGGSPSGVPFLTHPFPGGIHDSSIITPQLSTSSAYLGGSFLAGQAKRDYFGID